MRILVVEDDPHLGRILLQGLEEEGMAADLVDTAEEARGAALGDFFDVLSLDVMIRGGDGFTVCSELRHHRLQTPILMLTALDGVEDRVRGLEAGADDY